MREGSGRIRKIGIMGGTFDPIHIGHLILGERSYEQFGLEKVLFMPSGNPPHKIHRVGGASNEQRTQMVRDAIRSNPHFELSLEEMHELGYIYTSQTLTRLTAQHPDTEYYFIIGADSLLTFDTWHEPDVIASKCTMVVAVRNHLPERELDEAILRMQEKFQARILKLSSPNIDLSSSMIREWIREGRSCRYYLPDSVIDYIARERIYHGTG